MPRFTTQFFIKKIPGHPQEIRVARVIVTPVLPGETITADCHDCVTAGPTQGFLLFKRHGDTEVGNPKDAVMSSQSTLSVQTSDQRLINRTRSYKLKVVTGNLAASRLVPSPSPDPFTCFSPLDESGPSEQLSCSPPYVLFTQWTIVANGASYTVPLAGVLSGIPSFCFADDEVTQLSVSFRTVGNVNIPVREVWFDGSGSTTFTDTSLAALSDFGIQAAAGQAGLPENSFGWTLAIYTGARALAWINIFNKCP